MITEFLTEGWVKFTRFHCKTGYIDRWVGDCVDNPNNKNKKNVNLNAMASFYRFNDREWIDSYDLRRNIGLDIVKYREDFSAEDILKGRYETEII